MKPEKGWSIALWVAQIMLAAMFFMAGGGKLAMSAADFAALPNAATNPVPFGLIKFIGVSEVAGALGMLLPAVSRIKPMLTPLAALGLLIIMVLACILHLSRSEWSGVATTATLGALAAFVAWGRWKKAPIPPRS